jgi:two-component system sensor histidine kinase AlgZ
MPGRGLYVETLRALLRPRRLLPIVLVCAPLVAAQGSFSKDPLAVPLALATCLAFVLVAPATWRGLRVDETHGLAALGRALLYAALGGGVVLLLGVVVPALLGMGHTFLTHRLSVGITCALFLVGGWGLGRDLALEASLARERQRTAVLAREAEQAQLLALRAHLDPHFLFNTLNAIAEWCRQDGETAERAILQLSSILRAVLEGVRAPAWPLERELELVRTLFSLHEVRDHQSFSLDWQVDAAAGAVPVPPMVLLPLADNAVKHGPAAGHRGAISVAARLLGDRVEVVLENPGPYRGPRPGSAGLPTVARRLALAYGAGARLAIAGTEGRTRVTVSLSVDGPLSGVVV